MQGIRRKLARSPASSLTVLGVVLSMATIVLFLTDLEARYQDRIATAKKDAQSFATILAEHTALTFDDVNEALLEAEAIRKDSLSGEYSGPDAANAALRQLQKSSSVLVAIGWTDASGQLIAHSYDRAPPRSNISEMPHFIAQRDVTEDRLFIAPPYHWAASDKWFTAASRRLSNADGSFAGVVTASIDQSYFLKIFRSIDLGKAGSVLLFHRDGLILARQPEAKEALGKSFADIPLFTKYLPASETGSFDSTSPIDGVARVVGYRVVSGVPLVLMVSYARSDVLDPWFRHLYTFGPLVVAIVFIILFGTFVLVRQTNALAAKTRALENTNARFDAAISNMSQGLCLFDADKRLVISNNRFQEMYHLPDELVRPGTPLPRILQHYVDRGEKSDLTVDQHTQRMPSQLKQNFQPADGREILIKRKPLPDGGWVATHEDITEQKRAEQLLAEKAAELEAMNICFDTALSNMSQGLCVVDADHRVVVSNARYGEIYHLGRDQIKPGTSLRQIFAHRRKKGTHFAANPDVYTAPTEQEVREVRELADGRVIAISLHPVPTGGFVSVHEDITERARSEKRIAFLAQHDLLTGLANRALFAEKLDDTAKRQQRHGTTFTVLALDLDRFKNVNDTLGHPAGDQLLIEVAHRLSSSLRDTDVLARFGGDEFAIIQENEKNQSEGAIKLALRIIELIQQPFELNGHRVNIGTSIGLAFAPEHGTDAVTLLKKADLALYAAKAGGRNDFRVFQPELIEAADVQKSMESELREAISHSEFEMHYQPVIDAKTRSVRGVEAFVRWHHPSRGLLLPGQFLPLAEQTGLMLPLGEWILQQACADAAAWPPHVRLAVNISPVQFNKGNLFDVVLCALVESGLAPERLELEIAETSLLEKTQAHLQTMRQLKSLGVSMVLDNCGTGYSSANYLTGFPFDKIKIDRPVSQGFATRRDCAAVVASVLALARGLDIVTAAKGVEKSEQFEALQAAGVDFAQGYLFGRPVPHAELDLEAAMPMAKNVA
jgi:diguanylate cyclase (GGDEF)-like protein